VAALILSATAYADGWRGWFTCDARFERFAAAVAEGGDGIGLTEAIFSSVEPELGVGLCRGVLGKVLCLCSVTINSGDN
jgi:hypothetical protein